ncbi:MAG: succinate dehydrogenase cytochrome b subunit [Bacteroidia bacterium]|nr:succinate dehydrogenase cytochrome b subunit [Bacteroidia bacterium]
MSNFFTTSIGKKLVMSLCGLFLAVFLLVHLSINSLLIICDNHTFNVAANFMAKNKLIKVVEIVLFLGLFLHIIYGIWLQIQNWMSRPVGYVKTNHSQTSFFSKYMIHTAIVIFIFLVLHFMDFFLKAKFFKDQMPPEIGGLEDMATAVILKFKMLPYVIIYIVCIFILGFHLFHSFQSAFQTLGLDHKIYTPIIKTAGVIYALIIIIGYSLIPLVVYFTFPNPA